MLVIAQKQLKIESDLDELKKQGRDTLRLLNNLYTKIDQTSAQLFEKKQHHQSEETECQLTHQALVERLKNEEMTVLKLDMELVDLARDIEYAKHEALERHREALSWETKWKLANETKEYRTKEHDAAGEIGVMKAEIHRMEVRFLQLRRAQEKLAIDMEHCVLHRDSIFTNANIKHKMPDSKTKSRFTVLHRLNDVKNKIKLAQNEMGTIDRDLGELYRQTHDAMDEIKVLEHISAEEEVQIRLLCNDIELASLNKQAVSIYLPIFASIHIFFRTRISTRLFACKTAHANTDLCSALQNRSLVCAVRSNSSPMDYAKRRSTSTWSAL